MNAGDVTYFRGKRDELRRALAEAGRDPDGFAFAAQVHVGRTAEERRAARDAAVELGRAGATHVVVGITAGGGPAALADAAEEVAVPVRDALG